MLWVLLFQLSSEWSCDGYWWVVEASLGFGSKGGCLSRSVVVGLGVSEVGLILD